MPHLPPSITLPGAGRRFRSRLPRRPKDGRLPDEAALAAFLQPSVPAFLQILEITDSQDRPLMLLQPDAALRQKLYRRIACTAVRGKGEILYLYRRAGSMLEHQGRWDLCSGPVLAGEAREDAARRLLLARAGLADPQVAEILRRPANRESPAQLTLFAARLPQGVIPDREETLAVDADELEGLVAHTPELLTPALIWAAGTGRLFS